MAGGERTWAICGTLMHAPRRGECEILENALVEVGEDGTIRAVLAAGSEAHAARKAALEASPRLTRLGAHQYLLPGFVDLHIHAPQWPQLGKALHLPLDKWLARGTFPLEARYADEAFARRIYRSLVANLLANGTTTAVYFGTIHRAANRALAEICLELGQRALVGKVAMDDPSQCPDYYRDGSADESVEETAAFIDWLRGLAGVGGLVRPVVTPRFIPSCSDRALQGLGRIAAETGAHVQTHCSESDWEHRFVLERMGRSDTAALNGFGLLTRRTVLAHCNFVSPADADLIASRGAGIAHCPLSNFYFANAVFPLRALLGKGLNIGLGTDISGGPSASMFDSCRQAIAASRALEDGVDPARPTGERGRASSRINFRHAFWLATAGGGEVLDLPVGIFAPGYQFDAITVDTAVEGSDVHCWDGLDGLEDRLQKIVYGAHRSNILAVWVGGRQVIG